MENANNVATLGIDTRAKRIILNVVAIQLETSTCTDTDPKEWTIGTINDCSSECTGGPPCSDYEYVYIPCYATQACVEGTWSYDSVCAAPPEDCTFTYLGICQHCTGGGAATVVKGPDCQCK